MHACETMGSAAHGSSPKHPSAPYFLAHGTSPLPCKQRVRYVPSSCVLAPPTQYYVEREKFNPMSYLKNPMVLIVIATMGMAYVMPKMVDNMDEGGKAKIRLRQPQWISSHLSLFLVVSVGLEGRTTVRKLHVRRGRNGIGATRSHCCFSG